MHFPVHLILELWRHADFPLLIAVSRHQITSVWRTMWTMWKLSRGGSSRNAEDGPF